MFKCEEGVQGSLGTVQRALYPQGLVGPPNPPRMWHCSPQTDDGAGATSSEGTTLVRTRGLCCLELAPWVLSTGGLFLILRSL